MERRPTKLSSELKNFLSAAIEELSSPDPDFYLGEPYPCHLDETVTRLIDVYISSKPDQRLWIVEQLGDKYWSTFTCYAERMAIWAVRLKQPELILKGLFALALDDGRFDDREDILIMAPLYHSAVKLGIDPKLLFLQAAAMAGPGLATALRQFPDRPESNRNLASMGYSETKGPEGFGYRRNW